MKLHTASVLIAGVLATAIIIFIWLAIWENVSSSAKQSKWIEFSNQAYYSALSDGEQALSYMLANPNGTTVTSSGATWTGLATSIPEPGKGNSLYNTNWNLLTSEKPVQIVFSGTKLLTDVVFDFRVPKLPGCNADPDICTLSANDNDMIVNWRLSIYKAGKSYTIEPHTESLATTVVVAPKGSDFQKLNFKPLAEYTGHLTSDEAKSDTVKALLGSSLDCSERCILRFSLARPIQNKKGSLLPGLEYRARNKNCTTMNTDSPRDDANNEIPPSCYFGSAQPSPTITISSTQTRGAYSQTYELQRRKNTQSSAFDFTVLQ